MVQINSAESNRAQLRYVKEVTWGTTPASGEAVQMRITSSGLETSKETEVSEEIRADRMVPSIIEVAASSGGEIEMEFSAGSMDPFIEAFLLGAWSQPMNFWGVKGASVDITDTDTITVAGRDWTDYLTAGRYIKTEGFLNPLNNGYWEIASTSFTGGNTEIVITATTLVVEAGSAFAKVLDANDVVLADTGVTFTSGNTVDGGANNAFGGLQVGQKVWIEGLGKGEGSVVVTTTDPTEGATITINDGVDSYVLEIRTNAALVGDGNIHVALSGTEATQAASIQAAIMEQFRQQKSRVSASVSTATVTITNNRGAGGSIATSDATAFTVTNFAGGSATKSGFFTIASVPDNDTFTTEETLTADANAGTLLVVIKGSHVRNPGTISDITKQSFSIETGFTDVSKYFLRNGMRVGTLGFEIEAGSLVGATVSFMGRETTRSNTETFTSGNGYTPLDAPATEVLNATSNVGSIVKDGSTLSRAIMSITLEGESSLREQRAVGEKFPAGIGYGRFNLTGELVAYFDSFDLYDDFINHTTTSLSFDFTDTDFNTYYMTIPALKITSDPIAPEGIDQDVMENMEWTAQRDPSLNTQFMVDRFSSVWPFTAA